MSNDKDHVSALYEIQVCDAKGDVIYFEKGESKSFLKNFLLLLKAGMQNSVVSVIDLSGATRSCLGFSCLAGSYGIKNSNIIVGTGNSEVTPNDYALSNQIVAMRYAPLLITPQPTVPIVNGSNIESMMCKRTFYNNSGYTINVSELGIAVVSSTYSILILRDVIPAVPVFNEQTLHIAYTFRTAI